MASGDTLYVFSPLANEPPAADRATIDFRGTRPVLDFDATTQEAAIFSGVLPSSYAGGGLTVHVHWMATTATSGTGAWDIAIERADPSTDLDADSFATAQAIAAVNVPATSGAPIKTTGTFTSGAQMDSLVAGEPFRLRVRRDPANDSATGDLELFMVEIKET